MHYLIRIIAGFVITFFAVLFLAGGMEAIRINSLQGFQQGLEVAIMIVCIIFPMGILIDVIYKFVIWKKYGTFETKLKANKKIMLKGNAIDIYRIIFAILKQMKGVTIRKTDANSGLIIASGKPTLRASSQDMHVRIFGGSNIDVTVEISSKPHNNLMLLDFSKNVENVEKISNALNEEFQYGTTDDNEL
jgi:hypothetical protein